MRSTEERLAAREPTPLIRRETRVTADSRFCAFAQFTRTNTQQFIIKGTVYFGGHVFQQLDGELRGDRHSRLRTSCATKHKEENRHEQEEHTMHWSKQER